MHVSALLVSHNGARWLPAVVAGVAQQTARLDHHVAIDTGSRDESVQVLRGTGVWDVHKVDDLASYAESVRLGLQRIPRARDDEPEWIWLLHDDSAPDPHALRHLIEAAAEHSHVSAFGPKLREWPSLRRLLELGVTISGNGRRETGLERGEYDQGQHDERRVVLAANTAGLLVRRDALEGVGFDPALPLYGNDIDFGWRAARQGHPTMVVPEAVVFHAEAAARGQRSGALTTHHHRDARAAALHTLLANGSGRALPFRALWLLVAGVVRAVGLLLVRAPREAWGEISALGSTLGHPGRLLAARRERAASATVPAADVWHLLAPAWLPLRHLLDDVADLGSAVVDIGRERIGGRSVRTASTVELDDEESSVEPSLFGLLVTDPRLWLVLGSLVVGLVAARDLLGGGALNGGALPAAPDGVGHWWTAWLAGHHDLGTGSAVPAPGYVLPFAALGTLLLGHPGWAVWLVVVLGVPLSFLSAVRFLRRVTPGTVAPLAGAAAYALLPVVSGALAQGRIGTLVGAIVLPWLASAALNLRRGDDDLRWRAVWRTTLWLGLLVAFVPAAWLIALVLLLVMLLHGLVTDRATWRRAGWWLGPLVILVVAPVLVLPWFVGALAAPGALLVEAGRATAVQLDPGVVPLLLGRLGGPGSAPEWIGVGVLLAGLVGVVRADTRPRVLVAWSVSAAAALVVLLATTVVVSLPGIPGSFHPYAGFPLLVLQAGLVTAATVAAHDLRDLLTGRRFALRAPVAAVGLAAAAVAVVGGLGWWLVGHGTSDPLHRGTVAEVPAYMTELSENQPADGVLVLRGGLRDGVDYQVLRQGSLSLGDDAIAASTPPDASLTGLVQRLLADPRPDDARRLASYGVAYVYAPAPVSARVSGALDAGAGFSRASASSVDDASWRLQEPASLSAARTGGQPLHLLWVALQALVVIAVVVLSMPTRRRLR